MDIGKKYVNCNTCSVCFCILENKCNEQIIEIQEQFDRSLGEIRMAFVYGNQTVASTGFRRYFPGCYTWVEDAKEAYEPYEALLLSYGLLTKEAKSERKLVLILVTSKADLKYDKEFDLIWSFIENNKEEWNLDIYTLDANGLNNAVL